MSTENRNIKWAFLCSSWGKNASDIMALHQQVKIANTEITLVIYEEENCGACVMAQQNNIETLHLAKSNFDTQKNYQERIVLELVKRNIHFVFLLGFKHIIREPMLLAFKHRIVNVHPSLFPSFLGTKTAIQDALDYGVKITGITTHIIDHKVDYGTILFQKAIQVTSEDTFESLYPKFSKEGLSIIVETIEFMNKRLLTH
jgi:phosphoribosylglycinamide formyltransferase-1